MDFIPEIMYHTSMAYIRVKPRKTNLGSFAGVEASDDVRIAFSSQLDSLKSQNRGPGTRSTTLYQRAMTVIADLVRYTPWDSSWAPIKLGGYYSSAEIRSGLDDIAYNNKPLSGPTPSIPAPPPIIGAAPRPTTQTPIPAPGAEEVTPPPAASQGPSVAEGIASILNPLATAGAGIFQSQQQANLAKLAARAQASSAPTTVFVPQAAPSSTGLIVGVVGGAVVLLLVVVMLSKK